MKYSDLFLSTALAALSATAQEKKDSVPEDDYTNLQELVITTQKKVVKSDGHPHRRVCRRAPTHRHVDRQRRHPGSLGPSATHPHDLAGHDHRSAPHDVCHWCRCQR